MSSFVFMSPLSSTIVAPALPAIASDLNITQQAVEQMVLSIFLLGFACGSLVASPLSEIYGRIGGGTLSDLFRAQNRGKAVAIYSWSPILAPLRWTFYASSLLSIAIQLLGLIFLEETYPPLLLRRKNARQAKATGANNF
ncbi:MFS general substrate transporter [Penicillium malachiteum]|nr:MFS general substrate transporter [Penicillium malachiteum]